MKKLLSAIAVSVSSMMLISTAMAAPHAPQQTPKVTVQNHQFTTSHKAPQKMPAPVHAKKVQKAVAKVGQNISNRISPIKP